MKVIRVNIERGKDGLYSTYMPDDNNIPFGAIGECRTPKEAQEDFMAVVEAMREDYADVIVDLQFDFSYDIP